MPKNSDSDNAGTFEGVVKSLELLIAMGTIGYRLWVMWTQKKQLELMQQNAQLLQDNTAVTVKTMDIAKENNEAIKDIKNGG